MNILHFEDIIAWQKAKSLTLQLYLALKASRDFSYRDQILRAATSIMNNIAEGFERKGDREFRRFLSIAKGSCGEVRSMLYLGYELEYYSKEQFEDFYHSTTEISRLLAGLMKTLDG